MGLDNGLNVIGLPPVGYFKDFSENDDHRMEICYWRKFWNLRNEIVEYLMKATECEEEEFAYVLQLPQVEDVRDIIAKYTDLEYVKKHNGYTFWEEDEVVDTNKRNLKNLDELLKIMKKSPGLLVYFYDSY